MKHYDPFITLTHILDAIESMERFTADHERDERTLHAVARQFEIIGEATNRLGRDFCALYPDVPWRDMIDLRNFIMHGYDQVSPSIIWKTVYEDIPLLKPQIAELLKHVAPQE